MINSPKFKWEWNLNTVVVLLGFASGFIMWGWQLNEIHRGREINAANIERIDKVLATHETALRRLDNHELRLSNVEKQMTDSTAAMRAVESAIGSLSSDIRVVREILQRLEANRGRVD